jgi:hypothetical protein
MLSFEHESGQVVIERFLAAFPIDKRDIAAKVLDMALLAVLIIFSSMQSLALLPLVLDSDVAEETFLGRQFTIVTVALGAISDTLQRGVSLAQLSG